MRGVVGWKVEVYRGLCGMCSVVRMECCVGGGERWKSVMREAGPEERIRGKWGWKDRDVMADWGARD